MSFQDVSDCRDRPEGMKEGHKAAIKGEKKAVLNYLTAMISSDRFISDLMLKQMHHFKTDKPTCLREYIQLPKVTLSSNLFYHHVTLFLITMISAQDISVNRLYHLLF